MNPAALAARVGIDDDVRPAVRLAAVDRVHLAFLRRGVGGPEDPPRLSFGAEVFDRHGAFLFRRSWSSITGLFRGQSFLGGGVHCT